jgi:hypothetical protein
VSSKVCPDCGFRVPLRDFYRKPDKSPSAYCMEHTRKRMRERYALKRTEIRAKAKAVREKCKEMRTMELKA